MDYPLSPDEVSEYTREKVIFSSYAESIYPSSHWDDLRIIYTKVHTAEKKVKSRAGMKTTVKTNPLYKHWVEYEETVLLKKVIEAVGNRDFSTFADLTMKLCNGLHAMAMYTAPRISYLNDVSQQIIDSVLMLNESETKAAYTFDAGPNAVIFTLKRYVHEIVSSLREIVGEENIFVTSPGKGAHYEVIE